MSSNRKVTVVLPAELLKKAQRSSRKGITPTIRQALELLAARQAYDEILRLRGKVRWSVDLDTLRDDRR